MNSARKKKPKASCVCHSVCVCVCMCVCVCACVCVCVCVELGKEKEAEAKHCEQNITAHASKRAWTQRTFTQGISLRQTDCGEARRLLLLT